MSAGTNLDLLRRAANVMRETHRQDTDREAQTFVAVADWLDDQAERWEFQFKATQTPSRGVDQLPAIYYGNPEGAAKAADYHARHALAVARAYLGESA